MSEKNLEALGHLARERDAERRAWEQSDEAARLTAPLDEAERARVLRNVLGPKPEPERPRLFAWTGGLAAAAAAVAITFVLTATPALPRYTLEVPTLGYSAVRGEAPPAKTLTLTKGMALDVVLRPADSVEGEVAARSFVVAAKDRRVIDWPAEIAPTGAVRFTGRVGERPVLPAGASKLVFAVGRPDDVARWAEGESDGEGLVRFELDVVVTE
ncbi:hypothetical protein L6R52_40635 [Myxococcota bacterium]|nr:hypothetical protein [Myxococcota bacterium]